MNEIKWLEKHAISAVQSGSHALEYDNGDLEALRAFLKKAFPECTNIIKGIRTFYIIKGSDEWFGADSTVLPSILLSEIQPDEPEFVNGDFVEVSQYKTDQPDWIVGVFIGKYDSDFVCATDKGITRWKYCRPHIADKSLRDASPPATLTITTTYPVDSVILNGITLQVKE